MTKPPATIDSLVGARLRARRQALQLDEDEASRRLGITLQQLQKYESGAARMSSGRLKQLGTFLDVPIGYFFAEDEAASRSSTAAPPPPASPSAWPADPDAMRLLAAYARIQDLSVRRSIVTLVERLAPD